MPDYAGVIFQTLSVLYSRGNFDVYEIRLGKRVKVKMSEKVMKAIDPESNVEN